MRALVAAFVLLAAPLAAALEGSYESPEEQPEMERVFEGGFITAFEFAADGKIVVAELTGTVREWDPATGKKRALVATGALTGPEWGLTGLALDLDHATNGAFYTMYTWGPNGTDPTKDDVTGELRVSRWEAGKETIVYTGTATRSHNGGRILVVGDQLFVTLGEHTRGEEPMEKRMAAQDPATHAGKVLRMTLDGKPYPGNPAETDPRFDPYVYAYGLRNPFGIAWDPKREVLLVPDPAQDKNEEVNLVEKGKNYGWPVCVGPCATPRDDLVDPIVLYPQVITPLGGGVVGLDYYIGGFNENEVRRIHETPEGWTDEIVAKVDAGMLDVDASPDKRWIYVGTWNGLWRFPTPQVSLDTLDDEPPGDDPPEDDDPPTNDTPPVDDPPEDDGLPDNLATGGSTPGAGIFALVAAAAAVAALRRR